MLITVEQIKRNNVLLYLKDLSSSSVAETLTKKAEKD